jgi:hypothetical protein
LAQINAYQGKKTNPAGFLCLRQVHHANADASLTHINTNVQSKQVKASVGLHKLVHERSIGMSI